MKQSNDDFFSHGFDPAFFALVYRRSAVLGIASSLMSVAMDQSKIGLGILCGLAMGIFSLWTVEATVRLLFRGGSFPGAKLAIAAIVKMPFVLGGLLAVAWASFNGHLNVFGVVGGMLLLHAVLLVLAVGRGMAHFQPRSA